MYLRKMRREYPMEESMFPESEVTSPDPSQLLQLNEVSELLAHALEALPERTREIFRLNRQEGLKYREIAVRLSISIKTVESNMGKALKALRHIIEKYEEK